MTVQNTPAAQASTIELAGTTVARMGFGSMRLPAQQDAAVRVLRRAVESGVQVIDTAWYYGDNIANAAIAEALRPYSDDLVIVTKLGYHRASGQLIPAVTPEQLRQGNDNDRRVLGLDSIPVTHLRWSGADSAPGGVTFHDALGTMLELQSEGRIQHIGLSNVTLAQLNAGLETTSIASISNAFGIGNPADRASLDLAADLRIPYLPCFPLGGHSVNHEQATTTIATRLGVTPTQVALAWLLAQSPMVIAIPGTGQLAHLDENIAAASLALTPSDLVDLSR